MSTKKYIFACYHENDEDTAYDFNRIIMFDSYDVTICDGWNYRYIGEITIEKSDESYKNVLALLQNINDSFKELQKNNNIICDYQVLN